MSDESGEESAPEEEAAGAPHAPATITRLLGEMSDGNAAAADRLLPIVYERLRRMARKQRGGWRLQTLNTTALVHEAYLKLAGQEDPRWDNRAHFYAVAAKAMRHILVDYARKQKAQKRGGDRPHLPVSVADPEDASQSEERAAEVISLDRALSRLEAVSQRQSRVVECRFFAGMTIEETAAALDVSASTVKRDWTTAKAWLFRAMKEKGGPGSD